MGRNTHINNLDRLTWSADALDRLEELAGAKDYIDVMIEHAVIECRVHGMVQTIDVVGNETRHDTAPRATSWAKIGDALGISRQAAYERYRHLGDS